MRAPVDHIYAPAFPRDLPWVNSGPIRIDQLRGEPVLIEFWDFCRANSLRTLPYLREWHARYAENGLHVIGVHSAGYETSSDPERAREAVARLGIEYPVVIDVDHQVWVEYENVGWPARYLFSPQLTLFEYHFGEGGYEDTELAVQELLGIHTPTMAPLRAEEERDALLTPCSPEAEGPYSGPYTAGSVWAVLDGAGTVSVNGRRIEVTHPGAYELITHPHSVEGSLEMSLSSGVRCEAVSFVPGLARPPG